MRTGTGVRGEGLWCESPRMLFPTSPRDAPGPGSAKASCSQDRSAPGDPSPDFALPPVAPSRCPRCPFTAPKNSRHTCGPASTGAAVVSLGKPCVHSPRSPVVSSSGLGLCPQPLSPSLLGTPRASLGDGCPLGAVLPSGRVTAVLLSPERRAGRGSASWTPRQHRVPLSRTDTVPISFLFLKLFFKLIYLEREAERAQVGGRERG